MIQYEGFMSEFDSRINWEEMGVKGENVFAEQIEAEQIEQRGQGDDGQIEQNKEKEVFWTGLLELAKSELGTNAAKELPGKEGFWIDRLKATEAYFNQEKIGEIIALYQEQYKQQESLSEQEKRAIEAHFRLVLERGFLQKYYNQEQDVSHGFNHSLDVMEISNNIIEVQDQLRGDIQERYGLKDEESVSFVIKNVALFHDFGYPDCCRRQLHKNSHALYSSDIVNIMSVAIEGEPEGEISFKDLLGKFVYEENDEQKSEKLEKLYKDFFEAVFYHNADRIDDIVFVGKIKTNRGEFLVQKNDLPRLREELNQCERETIIYGLEMNEGLKDDEEIMAIIDKMEAEVKWTEKNFRGRQIDFAKKKDRLFGIEHTKFAAEKNPLALIIHWADNLDISKSRLTDLQQHEVFRDFYWALGAGKENSEYSRFEYGIEQAKNEKESAEKVVVALIYFAMRDLSEGENRENSEGADFDYERIKEPYVKELLPELKKLTVREIRNYWKNWVFERLIEKNNYQDLDEVKMREIKYFCEQQKFNDFRHFGGYEAINGVELKEEGVYIEIDVEKMQVLNKTVAVESLYDKYGNCDTEKVVVGMYQVWRLKKALPELQIYINGELLPGRINEWEIFLQEQIYYQQERKNYNE